MFSSRFVRWTRLDRLARRDGVSDRAVAVVFTARMVDEVLSSAWVVLAPTFRAVGRLSLVQVGLLLQACNWTALVVEPLSSAWIDLRSRRALMFPGALALAVSMLVMGVAREYAVLLAAFGLYGIGSGPLVLTADVLVIESFPGDPERAFSRATFVDTLGALSGPALVALAEAGGVSWRLLLVALGAGAFGYAVAIRATHFPTPVAAAGEAPEEGGWRQLGANARTVLRHAEARRWLAVLLCLDLFEAAFVLKYVWLHDAVGLSQPLVALWAVAEHGVDLVALALLDGWLARRDAVWLLRAAAFALVVLPALWVEAPGVVGRIIVGIPLAFAWTLLWPLAKSQQLTALPERAGAAQALAALFPILPLAVLESQLASAIGTGAAMALTAGAGAVLLLAVLPGSLSWWRAPQSEAR
ncbi:MAG: MFS transporter [Acidimicrobiales bacterium]